MKSELDMLNEALHEATLLDLSLPLHHGTKIPARGKAKALPTSQPKPRRQVRRAAPPRSKEPLETDAPEGRASRSPIDVPQVVTELLSHAFQVRQETVTPDRRLGGWCVVEKGPDFGEDELDRVLLVLNLQERFRRSFKDAQIETWHTVSDIISAIEAVA